MAIQTVTRGIVQSDLIIRTALLKGLEELRENPWLLDYVFASLPADDLTSEKYGDKDLAQAKKWFLNTDIKVAMAEQINDPKMPMISIRLMASQEAEATLGDIHYQPSEDIDPKSVAIQPLVILAPFTAVSYDSATGTVTLPNNLTTDDVVAGQYLFCPKENEAFQIQEVLDTQSFTVPVDSKPNLTQTTVIPKQSLYSVRLESVDFKEIYRLTLFCHGEMVYLTYLFSIVMFVLLRGKQEYLEKRGFERTQLSAADVQALQDIQPEVVYARTIDITGFARNYWPKMVTQKMEGIKFFDADGQGGIRIISGMASPLDLRQELINQGWAMDVDDLTQDSLG